MLLHLTRIGSALGVVLAAYLAYSVAAVPLIEPSVRERKPLVGDGQTVSSSAAKLRQHALEDLFAPGSWELAEPTVLETDQGMLLIRDYTPLGDDRLELKPCTLILYASSDEAQDGGRRRCVVMQAPQGAVLQSDQPMDLARGQFGSLQGGRLVGPVTIRSPESRPGAEDQVLLRTRDVQITPQRIVAPHEVEFRYGRSHGSGRDLIVSIETPDQRDEEADDADEAPYGRLRSLELTHVNQILLHLDDPQRSRKDRRESDPTQTPSATQLAITCGGPFRYDFQRQVATCEDRVVLRRPNADGSDDRLDCQWLAVYLFARNAEPAQDASEARGLPDMSVLELERIEARGDPAVLRAPSYSASARGQRLEYDFRIRQVRIEDGQKVMLWYGQNEMQARNLEYRLADGQRLGVLKADGPGVLRGVLPDDPDQRFEAAWNERLVLQPDQGDHAISLLDGAVVRYQGQGEFAADDIHVWLRAMPQPGTGDGNRRVSYQPVRMLAERDVRIDSWQMSGRTQRAEVWIQYGEEPSAPAGGSDAAGRAQQDSLRPEPRLSTSPRSPRSNQKFDLDCRTVQVQLQRLGERLEVERLLLDGDVRLREIRTAKPGEAPMEIRGDLVRVEGANAPGSELRVQGTDAVVAGRGMAIQGNDIWLRRGENRMEVDGPGTMTLTSSAAAGSDRSGSAASGGGAPATIRWKGHMEFDGRVARFLRDVQVRAAQTTPRAESVELLAMGHELDATLNAPVDFSRTQQDPDLDVRQLAFRGGVFLRSRTHRQGAQTALDQMQVRDLSLDRATGRLHALGPGWGSSVRFRASVPVAESAMPESAGDGERSELVYVRVQYEDEIVGNVQLREMEFRGRVNTVYGPVSAWDETLDPDPPDGPGEGIFLLTSDRLALAEAGPRADGTGAAIELLADGDATIEGKGFTARGGRISYARAKDLMILEGDGRNDAQLWFQGSTTPDAAAEQIRFWPRTRSIQVDRGRMLDLSRMGPPTP